MFGARTKFFRHSQKERAWINAGEHTRITDASPALGPPALYDLPNRKVGVS